MKTTTSNASDDYGEKLYNLRNFEELFENFEVEQGIAAQVVWDRILSRCGEDPDLPPITTIVDYGCGDGTLLKKFAILAKGNERTQGLIFIGIDCSAAAIEKASLANPDSCLFNVCSHCPKEALDDLGNIKWTQTALLSMCHTWFHLDQKSLVSSILKHRPALLLIDIFATWDRVITQLKDGKSEVSEHGRRLNDGTCYLVTKLTDDGKKVTRGLQICDLKGKPTPIFETTQAAITTGELIGHIAAHEKPNSADTLLAGRTKSQFVERMTSGLDEIAFVRRRTVPHESGWGAMNCHALTSRDLIADVLNNAYFDVIKSLIDQSTWHGSSRNTVETNDKQASGVKVLLELFNEKAINPNEKLHGSREALVLLPFDSRHTFARIVPLFENLTLEISRHLMLLELPSLAQMHFPSANGLFQTCLSRSSSAQAFPTEWARDYVLSEVDKALIELELVNFGLDKEGYWQEKHKIAVDKKPEKASYFMLPVYFGSLPLFVLALKFPRTFDPTLTAFDVYFSALRSLHDAIGVFLTDDVIRRQVLRPWIESVLLSPHWPKATGDNLDANLDKLEEYIFGKEVEDRKLEQWQTYNLGKALRSGGVLGMEWKSWILGLPSIPIKKLASVEAINNRLWSIWNEEKLIAKLDPALRISAWFQEGRFFEDDSKNTSPHDYWICAHHLDRVRNMFRLLGYPADMKKGVDDSWLSDAFSWLKPSNPAMNSKTVMLYFGQPTVQHFLFEWMHKQLLELVSVKEVCADKGECKVTSAASCTRTKGPFEALKLVFCKTRANKGEQVRFSSQRLYWLLTAGTDQKIKVNNGEGPPQMFPDKATPAFWSEADPSIVLAELAHCLSNEKLLKEISINHPSGLRATIRTFEVVMELNQKLSLKSGGSICEHACECLRKFHQITNNKATVSSRSLFETTTLRFNFVVNCKDNTITIS